MYSDFKALIEYSDKLLETTSISAELTELINNATDKLFLISPYLQIAERLRLLIKERDSQKLDIRVVFRTDKLNAEELSFLQELTSVKVLACENLHSKCYLNENSAIITSMNLYQHSQQNNWEMGVKIEKKSEPEVYNEIYKEAMRIIQASQQPEFSIKKLGKEATIISKSTPTSIKNGNGFCIRCGTNIKLNPEQPLCSNCYKSWEKYSNPDYGEVFCHACGKEYTSTKAKPVCYGCYKKLSA